MPFNEKSDSVIIQADKTFFTLDVQVWEKNGSYTQKKCS